MMIPCPECDYTGHKGRVEKTLYQRFGGTLEPVGEGSIAITVMAVAKWRRMKMSDKTVVEFPSLSDLDRQFEELERQRELIREQARQLAAVHKPK